MKKKECKILTVIYQNTSRKDTSHVFKHLTTQDFNAYGFKWIIAQNFATVYRFFFCFNQN